MKIIAIRGVSNSGKTHSFWAFYDNYIVRLPEFCIQKSKSGHRKKGVGGVFGAERGKDYSLVATYCGKRIGVISMGDKRELIEENFRYVGDGDVVIDASHLRGQTVEYVKAKADGAIKWINKRKGMGDERAIADEMYCKLQQTVKELS